MPRVQTVFTSDDKDIIKSFHRQAAELAKMREQMARNAQSSRQFHDQQKSALSDGAKQIAGMIAQYGSMAGALRIVTAELERQNRLRREQAAATTQLADAEIKAMRNLGNASRQERARLQTDAKSISAATGVSVAGTNLALSNTLSARGSLSYQQAINATRAGLRLAPEQDGAEGQIAAGAALDLMKARGGSAEENLGFALNVAQRSRVTDLSAISQNVVPAITGVSAFGGDTNEAAALVAATTQASADVTGARSGSAAINFAEQLRAAVPQYETLNERIQFLQGADERTKRKFLKGLSLEKKQLPFFEQLITDPESAIAKEYAANISALPGLSGEETYANIVGGIEGLESQQVAAQSRQVQRGKNALLTASTEGAFAGTSREFLKSQIDASNIGFGQLGPVDLPLIGELGGVRMASFDANSAFRGSDAALKDEIAKLVMTLEKGTAEQQKFATIVQRNYEEFLRVRKQRPTYVQRPEN